MTSYVDNTMLDRTQRRRSFYNDNDHTVTSEERRDEIPEDLMEDLSPYVGDAKARITVSGSLSSSHEFHKAEAFVSVAVVVNNDLDDVDAVHGILRPYVQALCLEDHDAMSLLRDEILPVNLRRHGPPKGLPPAVDGKVAQPPKKSGPRAGVGRGAGKGPANKPSFGR